LYIFWFRNLVPKFGLKRELLARERNSVEKEKRGLVYGVVSHDIVYYLSNINLDLVYSLDVVLLKVMCDAGHITFFTLCEI